MSPPPATLPAEAPLAPRILVIDDSDVNRRLLDARLQERGYRVSLAHGGVRGLGMARAEPPDLILLDVMMPDLDGFQVCQQLRADPALEAVPIVMVTAMNESADRVRGLEVGADDFITRPFIKEELWARVRSLLRVKKLFDESRRQQAELAAASAVLAQRVEETTREVMRLSQLKRFFSPALAARLVAGPNAGEILHSHRRHVTVLFADLRGFSAFAEQADAITLMAMLRSFHAAMGALVFAHEGTLERFTGDGFMVFFNDPDLQPDHSQRAIRLALAMRDCAVPLLQPWQAQGGPGGLGLGISRGEATVGAIGFENRLDYAAIGSVTNRASRLCNAARPGEILICQATWEAVRDDALAAEPQPMDLRGFAPDQLVYPVTGLRNPD